jgi:predicted transcriptional regulator
MAQQKKFYLSSDVIKGLQLLAKTTRRSQSSIADEVLRVEIAERLNLPLVRIELPDGE